MNREQFIASLRKELKKLPPEEVVAATEYFEEYFDDVMESGARGPAGASTRTEADIIAEIGSPKRVAAQIKADYAARILDGTDETVEGAKGTKKISAVWWIIIGICSAPVSIPLALLAGFVAIWAVCGAIGMILGIYGTIIGCAAMAIFFIGLGFMAFGSSAASAVFLLGLGIAIGAASAAAGVGAFLGTKALCRGVEQGVRRIHENRKKNRGMK